MLQRLTLIKKKQTLLKVLTRQQPHWRAEQNPRHSRKIPKLYTKQAPYVMHTLKRN